MRRRPLAFAAFLALHAAASLAAAAELKLHSLFGDGMVIQRDVEAPIWGTATPGAKVELRVDGEFVRDAVADAKGAFTLVVSNLIVGKPHTLELKSADGATLTLRDVLAGDVWLCSGQSNMQWTLADSSDAAKEIEAATLPNVRLFYVPRVASGTPLVEPKAQWTPCTPTTAAGFSAVAYHFGRRLSRDLNVPIGLVHSSWGGTPAESWTPLAKLRTLGELQVAQQLVARGDKEGSDEALADFVARMQAWMVETGHYDEGMTRESLRWAGATFDDAAWPTLNVPGDARQQGVPSGSTFWLRRSFDVPAELAGKEMRLDLSVVDDFDQTFVNGQPVGQTTVSTPNWTSAPRSYDVRGSIVRAGRNVVAVRVHDLEGRMGFVGNANQIRAVFAAPSGGEPTTIPLAGEWRYTIEREGAATQPTTGPTTRPPRPMQLLRPDNSQFPGSLHNGMIAPLGPLGLKGVIWYQGESNAARAVEYAPLLSTMIGTWREQFRKPELPFYIVGLANFGAATDDPNKATNWGLLRQAQRDVARTVPHTATTVTIDVGDPKDIHPRDKKTVGERLALVALADAYGQQLVSRGPTLKSATRDGGKVALAFDHVGGGLAARGDKLGSFSVAGDDGKFAWADATIDGDRVIVSSPAVPTPTVVRYAYGDDPTPTLFNKEGLPAEPFEERVK